MSDCLTDTSTTGVQGGQCPTEEGAGQRQESRHSQQAFANRHLFRHWVFGRCSGCLAALVVFSETDWECVNAAVCRVLQLGRNLAMIT